MDQQRRQRLKRWLVASGALGGGSSIVTLTTFTQSLGVELLTDGAMENWNSATDLVSWIESISGTSTVNREASVIHGGTFATRFDVDGSQSAVGITQTVAGSAANDIWEVTAWMRSNPTGKTARIDCGGVNGPTTALTTSYAQYALLVRLNASGGITINRAGGSTSSSLYFDDFSVKKLTLNSQITSRADGTFTFNFTLPASPFAQQRIQMRIRMNAGTPLNDYIVANLMRNDANTAWDVYLDKVVSNTNTNLTIQTTVGTPDALRIVALGPLLDLYTGVVGVFTHQGSQASDAAGQTNTIINTVYSSAFTPVSLIYPT